jgi:hypothetical protein
MPEPVTKDLENWLAEDEARSRPFRAIRLHLMLTIFESPVENILFHGGTNSHQAYTELRLAFIHGLYLTTVILTLSCIEQELAGALFARGSDAPARMSLEKLLLSAKERREINESLYGEIDDLRVVRNSYTHYRPPLHPSSSIGRTLEKNIPLDELSEAEAVDALKLLARFIYRR